MLAVTLLIVGVVVGRVAVGPMGGIIGLVAGFLASGSILRTYFERRDASSDHT
jgi:hypothetical protein